MENIYTIVLTICKSLKTYSLDQVSIQSILASDAPYTIPHFWDNDYQVYGKSLSLTPGDCSPLAATNFMYYWGVKANHHVSSLWSTPRQVLIDLYLLMKTDRGAPGTYYEDILAGMQQYSKNRNAKIISNYNFDAQSYDKCVEVLKQKGPFMLMLSGDKKYSDHTVLAVGCGNNYLRILDGISTSRSNFFDSSYLVPDYARAAYLTY